MPILISMRCHRIGAGQPRRQGWFGSGLGFPAALLLWMGLSTALAGPWPHRSSDVLPDPRVQWHQLANGMRIALLRHPLPAGQVSLRLHFQVGSLDERDGEQGYAHLLEHMAFQGSGELASGGLVQHLQDLGMSFGPHTNAFTTHAGTTYRLEVTRNAPEILDDVLGYLRGIADGLHLEAAELQAESAVVLREMALRDSPQQRASKARLHFVFRGTPLPERDPVGRADTLRAVTSAGLRAFYRRHYHPRRTLLVAVGDFEPAALLAQLRRRFDTFRGSDKAVEPATLEIPRRPAAVDTYPRRGRQVEASLTLLRPRLPDTRAQRARDTELWLAHRMLEYRLSQLGQGSDPPLRVGTVHDEILWGQARLLVLAAVCRNDRWAVALGALERSLRGALNDGFSDAEFQRQRDALVTDARLRVQQWSTAKAGAIADRLLRSILDQDVYSADADDLVWLEQVLADTSRARVEAQFREAWQAAPDAFVAGVPGLAPAAVETALAKSRSRPGLGEVATRGEAFAYADSGRRGRVLRRHVHRPSGVVSVQFANRVRLNVLSTQREAGTVLVGVRFGSGRLRLPADKPGLDLLASAAFLAGGLGRHSAAELGELSSGHNVSTDFSVGNDAFQLHGSTTSGDLRFQLQLLAAFLVDPGYRPESYTQYLDSLAGLYRRSRDSVGGVLATDVARYLRGGDPRFGLAPLEQARARSLDELRDWLAQPLAKGYLEISLVGDVDTEQAIDLVAQTFGALPTRRLRKPPSRATRRLHFPEPGVVRRFEHHGQASTGMALVYWPTVDVTRTRDRYRLAVLTRIVSQRLLDRAREQLGASYAPSAGNTASPVFTNFGIMGVGLDVDPQRATEMLELVRQITSTLVAEGVGDEELERALRQEVEAVRRRQGSNHYWLGVLLRTHERPGRLGEARRQLAELAGIRPRHVNASARRFLRWQDARPVLILPAANGAGQKF
ncbi:MAG: insulinase family protein [Gammaproteobacteria bacterium]|nr:insulinase family protein [Gammaproteobacteria bacterium]